MVAAGGGVSRGICGAGNGGGVREEARWDDTQRRLNRKRGVGRVRANRKMGKGSGDFGWLLFSGSAVDYD